MKSEELPADRAARRAAKAKAKLAKAEAKLTKAEAKLEARRAKVDARKKAYELALAEAERTGADQPTESVTA